MFKLSNRSIVRREGVDPKLIEISDLAIQITKVDFGHPLYSGLRTAEEQNTLYRDKKSMCDGYVKLSRHQLGDALDFYAYVNGKASWEKEHLTSVVSAFYEAAMRLGYRIKWGGFFKSFRGYPLQDYPHIELINKV